MPVVGFTAGAWDLLHPGHVAFLNSCKDHCDQLIVALHVDPSRERPEKNKPVQTMFERHYQLNSCDPINYIMPYETEEDLRNMLACLDINVRFLGTEYENEHITGIDICYERNIDIIYIPRLHTFSSRELRTRLLKSCENSALNEKAQGFKLSPGVRMSEFD